MNNIYIEDETIKLKYYYFKNKCHIIFQMNLMLNNKYKFRYYEKIKI